MVHKNLFFFKFTVDNSNNIMYYIPCAQDSTNLIENAGVAELADAQASGACGSNIVWVQVPSPASFLF